MVVSDWINVVAILLSPLIALQVQKWIERYKSRETRQLYVFRTLMTTRLSRVSSDHVNALNMIDLEFSPTMKKEKAVLTSWKIYLGHLNSYPTESDQIAVWISKSDDLFTNLLYAMSRALGFDFDLDHLKRSIYSPKAHGEADLELQLIRKGLSEILSGQTSLPVELNTSAEILNENREYQKKLLDASQRTLNVRIVDKVD